MKRKVLSVFIFLATIALITVPLLMLTSAADTDTVSVTASVQNVAPTITYVQTGASATPSGGTTKEIQIRFNATDSNSVDDFADATAQVNITNAAVTLTSHACAASGLTGTMESWLCNITINYYQVPAAWSVTAYIADSAGNNDTDTSATFTINNLDSVAVTQASMAFTGTPGQTNVASDPSPIAVTNTGNQNYATVGVTAHDLSGGGDTIPATAFNVNISDSSDGQALADGSPVQVTGSTLARGAGATRNLYFYLDIPSGIVNASYSSAAWTFDPTV